MKKYRLKKEAVPFFNKKYATAIYDFDVWEKQGVDVVALEEVKDVFITYGHQSLAQETTYTSTCGWGSDKGSKFHFTINFPSMSFKNHDTFSNGKLVRELMNKIEKEMNSYFVEFNNDCA